MARWLRAAFGASWAGVLIVFALALPAAAAGMYVVNKDGEDIAIRGYDTVAYFTEGRAVKGKPEFEHVWQDAKWLFATAEHRDLFARDPERYAPRFGGFCTGGMSLRYIQIPDPENWSIIDGKLYLNHSRRGRDRLRANPGPIIAEAETYWAAVKQQYDRSPR